MGGAFPLGIGIAIGIGIEPDSFLPNLFDSDADTDPDTDACDEGRPGGYAGVQTSSQKESATRAGVGSS
jgi:hypothetical protein